MNLGTKIQAASVVLSVAGITIEIAYGADLGFVLITLGALVLAIGTKIKYYRR